MNEWKLRSFALHVFYLPIQLVNEGKLRRVPWLKVILAEAQIAAHVAEQEAAAAERTAALAALAVPGGD